MALLGHFRRCRPRQRRGRSASISGPPNSSALTWRSVTRRPDDNVPEQEYFADGMVEEIITALSRIRWLFVIARNSTFTYKGRAVDVKQVGRELGVRYVLEGSVRKAGGRVRITAQLIDALAGTHLWADRFDGSLEDVFELQDKVGRRSILIKITPTADHASQSSNSMLGLGPTTLQDYPEKQWLCSAARA
jgi:TolB-like protein